MFKDFTQKYNLPRMRKKYFTLYKMSYLHVQDIWHNILLELFVLTKCSQHNTKDPTISPFDKFWLKQSLTRKPMYAGGIQIQTSFKINF